MIIVDPRFAYHTLYSIIVGLVFYNKLFAALLLLDIFFQIPLLSKINLIFRKSSDVNLEAENLVNFSHRIFHSCTIFFQHLYVL